MSGNICYTSEQRVTAIGLRAWLDDRGIKHRWVARQVGMSAPQMSGLLSGRRTIRAETAEQICQLLGVPFSLAFESANAGRASS